ncbi:MULTISPECIES: uracil-DNA glycosylase [unclassified Oleiphilus]|uniref:uracil-DNA glycosylase n=1 Tax=unclassified Oleiphilus TaxID=2631174 RepID=UPI0007C2C306|nr:uracil-DNA glycosylase [Oleiphilus sp. HI0066]KZY69260.1 uracil-DNA glycosylase [Oleiphilus sp. HI0067]KZZ61389.1 uracil-DNA glycosylase [Oleiphilus sp. HI0125]
MMIKEEDLSASWKTIIGEQFTLPYMRELDSFLDSELAAGKTIYPASDLLFSALNATDFEDVRVIILGQDPYHGPNQAHGLSFSVQPGVKIPPSLMNIYKELETDIGCPIPMHGYLQEWAEQGVLLLNAVLTVEQANANAHQGKGWEQFTDAIIRKLNDERENLVFILWGSYAQKKGQFIDTSKHCVLTSVHPSPLSAHRGFFGSQPFSKANRYLEENGVYQIDWNLPFFL